MRILIAGFQHETNTFAPSKTGYDDFVRGGAFPAMLRGDAILDLRDINVPMGGFVREMAAFAQFIPVIWAGATPAAQVLQDAFERIAGEILTAARDRRFDAIYLDLHGAMVCEHIDDGEGELLRKLRQVVGPNVPIVASLDLHANVTRRMLENADALTAYRTYPHEDMAETGARAAHLLSTILKRGNGYVKSFRRAPFLIPINAMCTLHEPAKGIYQQLVAAECGDSFLSFTPGFPAADFEECGPMIFGYGYSLEPLRTAVERLSCEISTRESDWVVPFLGPLEAVREAQRIAAAANRPVIIADTQDNPGGGGNSDTTGLLRALLECNAQHAAMGLMVDAQAAKAAHMAGPGSDITIQLGGKSQIPGDAPFAGTFHVEQLSNGRCRFDGPMFNGTMSDVGPAARLSIGGLQIIVSTFKNQMLDRNLYRMAGVEPERMKILVNKSSVHFRADFQPIAEAVLIAKAPGPLLADPADFPWTRLAKGMRTRPNGTAFLS